jgi:hypothetical protein
VAGYDAATGTATVLVSDGTVEMINSGDRLLLDAGSWAMSRDDVGIVAGPTVTEDSSFDTVVSSDRPLSALSDVTDEGGSSSLLWFGIVAGAVLLASPLAVVAVKRRDPSQSV